MNVIIIAACIPTLRPLFLILLRRSTPSDFRPSHQNRHSSYFKHPSSDPTSGSSNQHPPTIGSHASKALSNANKAFDLYRTHTATHSTESTRILDKQTAETSSNKNSILVCESICVESREVRSPSDDLADEEREWGMVRGRQGVPLSEIGRPRELSPKDIIKKVREEEERAVQGENMV